MCTSCSYQCSTCASGDPQTCLTCSDVNRDQENNCVCASGYIDDGSSAACVIINDKLSY